MRRACIFIDYPVITGVPAGSNRDDPPMEDENDHVLLEVGAVTASPGDGIAAARTGTVLGEGTPAVGAEAGVGGDKGAGGRAIGAGGLGADVPGTVADGTGVVLGGTTSTVGAAADIDGDGGAGSGTTAVPELESDLFWGRSG